jgi:hypothetical protein
MKCRRNRIKNSNAKPIIIPESIEMPAFQRFFVAHKLDAIINPEIAGPPKREQI